MKKNSRVIIYNEYRKKISSFEYSFIDKDKDENLAKKIDDLLIRQTSKKTVKENSFKSKLLLLKRYYLGRLLNKKHHLSYQFFFYTFILLLSLSIGIFIVLVLLGVIK